MWTQQFWTQKPETHIYADYYFKQPLEPALPTTLYAAYVYINMITQLNL